MMPDTPVRLAMMLRREKLSLIAHIELLCSIVKCDLPIGLEGLSIEELRKVDDGMKDRFFKRFSI